MKDNKKILIICFSFPPFPGVGGRRWAKFAKYLSAAGYDLFVISAKNENQGISEWHSDVKDKPNIRTFEIPLGWSNVLSAGPRSVFQKIIYKVLWKSLPFLVKGNPQDKLFFVKNKFLAKAKEIIKEQNIKTVIVSIPPYKLAYYMLELKRSFPEIRFITDYRDPWTDNKSYHGFDGLDPKRFAIEEQFEIEVLKQSDVILNVHLGNLEDLKLKVNERNKFHHLLNGFDKDDYSGIRSLPKLNDKIRFIYSGSFYPNLIYLLEPFLKCLAKLKAERSDIYSKLQFDFYGGMDHNAVKLINETALEAVKYHGSISKNDILNEINRSDYCMMFAAPDYSFAFNTKFYDYLHLRKPIMYFGLAGKVSEYVSTNNVGQVFEHDKIEMKWYKFLLSLEANGISYNSNADVSEFELGHLTSKLIKILDA